MFGCQHGRRECLCKEVCPPSSELELGIGVNNRKETGYDLGIEIIWICKTQISRLIELSDCIGDVADCGHGRQ